MSHKKPATRRRARQRGQKPEYQIKIARERIKLLFSEAEGAARANPKRARRYVELARRIGMRYNVRIPRELKRRFCRECHAYLSGSVRIKGGQVRVKCFSCNKTIRFKVK